jgi:pantothenate kinase type III
MVIATGGLAELFAPLCESFDEVDPHLTLKGLEMAYRLVKPVYPPAA